MTAGPTAPTPVAPVLRKILVVTSAQWGLTHSTVHLPKVTPIAAHRRPAQACANSTWVATTPDRLRWAV